MYDIDHAVDIAAAARRLVEAWDGQCAVDNARHMTRTEMDAMADLFIAFGAFEVAAGMMEAWTDAEVEDREIEEGDLAVWRPEDGPPFIVDCTEAYSMTCTNCGRSGNREDMIELGGECVDEDCDGTIIPSP